MTGQGRCAVCGSDALSMLDGYERLPRVTSDTKPWPAGGTLAVCRGCGAIQKPPDERWRAEAATIYRDYEIYHLSGVSDQPVFNERGEPEPRARRIVIAALRNVVLPPRGRLLDIGCGNGAALAEFSRALPTWDLYGSELSDKNSPELRQIPNFVELYTCPVDRIDQTFSVISMVHALEHMPDPLKALRDAVGCLDRTGTIMVEVPDVETSPFDILVADHRMHFSRATLGLLCSRVGLKPNTLTNELQPKEITLIAQQGSYTPVAIDPRKGECLARSNIAWLNATVAMVQSIAAKTQVGIFGTAVAGMALYGAVKDRVAFFVDEDRDRVGRKFDNKPILHPQDAPRQVPIALALAPQAASRVSARWADVGLNFIFPPPYTPYADV
jgi:SAM-dependent methyltransferase